MKWTITLFLCVLLFLCLLLWFKLGREKIKVHKRRYKAWEEKIQKCSFFSLPFFSSTSDSIVVRVGIIACIHAINKLPLSLSYYERTDDDRSATDLRLLRLSSSFLPLLSFLPSGAHICYWSMSIMAFTRWRDRYLVCMHARMDG